MLSFRQFLLEAEDDWEHRAESSYCSIYGKKFGNNDVSIHFTDWDEKNEPEISYTVNKEYNSRAHGVKIDKQTATSILTQVRNKIDKHIQEKKPNKVLFASNNPTKIKLHDHYSKYLAKKYNGSIDTKEADMVVIHMVHLKH